ncbi:MAG: hypothetical protein AB1896_18585 [Thermodesulfobacteriota bacterium]
MPDEQPEERIQVHVSHDLEYVYRDVVNIFVGAGEVILEFGNRHRSMPEHVTISNRIVLSVAGAYDFHQRLGQTLQEAQAKLQQQLRSQRKEPIKS